MLSDILLWFFCVYYNPVIITYQISPLLKLKAGNQDQKTMNK